jgi:tRNA A37 threonylcarbamoyladenosine modification protein TsaB
VTLDVLARAAAGSADTVVALQDAFRGEVYSGVYDSGGRLRGERKVGPLAAVLEGLPAGSAFVGDAAGANRAAILAASPDAVFPETAVFLAGPLAVEALSVAAAGGAVAPSEVRPLYLRGADVRAQRP